MTVHGFEENTCEWVEAKACNHWSRSRLLDNTFSLNDDSEWLPADSTDKTRADILNEHLENSNESGPINLYWFVQD